MSNNSIKLSPKHGLNAFMSVCFWCGKDKELCVPGRINRADDKAPSKMLVDYEPCEECAELFSKGIHIIGVVTEPPQKGMPPISKIDGVLVYPTGANAVVPLEFINEVLLKPNGDEGLLEELKEKGKMLLDNELCLQIIDIIKSWQDEGDSAEEMEELPNENSETRVPSDSGTEPLIED